MTKKMYEKAVFLVGSRRFFIGEKRFCSKDTDWVHMMSGWFLPNRSLRFKDGENDRFLYPDEGIMLLEECVINKDPLTAGKFIVPEFCEYIGATIEDIRVLAPLFDKIDEKHKYEKIIFDSYMQNWSMTLTDSQRAAAYEEYKSARPHIYG